MTPIPLPLADGDNFKSATHAITKIRDRLVIEAWATNTTREEYYTWHAHSIAIRAWRPRPIIVGTTDLTVQSESLWNYDCALHKQNATNTTAPR